MRFIGIIGLFALISVAWLMSNDRRGISWRTVLWGLGLQAVLAVLVLGVPVLSIPGVLAPLFSYANDGFMALLDFTKEGSSFLFGPLLDSGKMGGLIFAVAVLPTIIFFSSLMSILYHVGLMQRIVRFFSFIMQRTMGTSGPESLSAAANIFVGQTEAPLLVRPYIRNLSQSELLAIMTAGMATVAGGIMAIFVEMLRDRIPDIAGHLMTASVMSAPAALAIAKIMFPETGNTLKETEIVKSDTLNIVDAAAKGASEGLFLALNVGAMLLAFIALIAMSNAIVGFAGGLVGYPELTLQTIFGWLFFPFAFLMGIPWEESFVSGILLGEKLIFNEVYAVAHLQDVMNQLSDRSVIILTYALSGFANFSSIAIQIGGIGGIAPERRNDLALLGIRSVIGGTLAAFMTATIAGLLN